MENHTHNPILDLPKSCKSASERMAAELEREELEEAQKERTSHESTFRIAQISDVCQEKLTEFEHELNKQGCWNIALVAYQKDC